MGIKIKRLLLCYNMYSHADCFRYYRFCIIITPSLHKNTNVVLLGNTLVGFNPVCRISNFHPCFMTQSTYSSKVCNLNKYVYKDILHLLLTRNVIDTLLIFQLKNCFHRRIFAISPNRRFNHHSYRIEILLGNYARYCSEGSKFLLYSLI